MITLSFADGRQIPISNPSGRFREFRGERLVQVRLYGELARAARRKVFELAVSSVREAINALHYLTEGRTTQYIDQTSDKVRWRVLVNDKQIDGASPSVVDELMIERSIETIDIYPIMEGAANWLSGILGALMIVAGVVLSFIPGLSGVIFGTLTWGTLETGLIVGGIAGVLGSLVSLFQTPTKLPKQKASQGNPSYLFSGVVNTQDQGGPVPVCYGKCIIGSQCISAWVSSSDLYQVNPTSNLNVTGNKLPSPFGLAVTREEGVSVRVTAMTQTWQELGPSGFWGYCNGVTTLPVAPNVPIQQDPTGLYDGGPEWLIRFDNGAIGANYTVGGNLGPWGPLTDCPMEMDPIVLTQAAQNYADFAATANVP